MYVICKLTFPWRSAQTNPTPFLLCEWMSNSQDRIRTRLKEGLGFPRLVHVKGVGWSCISSGSGEQTLWIVLCSKHYWEVFYAVLSEVTIFFQLFAFFSLCPLLIEWKMIHFHSFIMVLVLQTDLHISVASLQSQLWWILQSTKISLISVLSSSMIKWTHVWYPPKMGHGTVNNFPTLTTCNWITFVLSVEFFNNDLIFCLAIQWNDF